MSNIDRSATLVSAVGAQVERGVGPRWWQENNMNFQEWWESEERDADYFLPVIAEAAWDAAVAAEREKHATLLRTVAAIGINPEGGCDPDDVAALIAQLLAAERERCAAVCEALSAQAGRNRDAVASLEGDTGYECADAIRVA
jgi:hypothetical protein